MPLSGDEQSVLQAMERNRASGLDEPELEPSNAWVAQLAPARRALVLARYLLILSREPDRILPVLEPALASDDGDVVFEALLLAGALRRELGEDEVARELYRAAFASMGWTPPLAEAYRAADGIGIGLVAGARRGLAVVDGFCGADETLRIRTEIDRLLADGHLRTGGFYDSSTETRGTGRCDKHRGELLLLLERERLELPALRGLADALRRIVLASNYFEGTAMYALELQVAAYAPGAVYDRHTDASPGRERKRAITMIYYPNPEWDASQGGLLRLETPARIEDVEPCNDRLVAFPSVAAHEVTTCAAPRCSVMCWTWALTP